MKNNKKIIVISIIAIGIIISIICFTSRPKKEENNNKEIEQLNKLEQEFVQVMEDGSKLNTSTKLNQTKNIEGLEIGNIKLSMAEGVTTLFADVKNNTGKDVGVTVIQITLLDKNEAKIVTFGGVIGSVTAGDSVKLEASTTLDFANAYDFKVEIIK